MSLPSLVLLNPNTMNDDIFFKAYKNSEYRKLSNLFGPVEWKFQAAKFKPGSGIREWLQDNANRHWSKEEFDVVRNSMRHVGKLESYVAPDGEVASGLLAQMCSLIARNPEALDARKRLSYILNKPLMSRDQALEWASKNVYAEVNDTQKDELLKTLLFEKYSIPHYRELLLKTGTRVLHEANGRGAPNRYEYVKLTESQERENSTLRSKGQPPKWSTGGDVLGKLLMEVRSSL